MSAQHTPGPWVVIRTDGFSGIVGNADGDIVTPTGPSMANARLIAAAPDLLEALKLLINDRHPESIPSYKWSQARAAIAKAIG